MTRIRTQAAACESTHAESKNSSSSLRYVVITWRGVWAFPWSIMKHKCRIHLRNEIWYLTGVFPIFPWGGPFSTCLKMEEQQKIKCMNFTHLHNSNHKVDTCLTNLSNVSTELQIIRILIVAEPELTVIIRCHCKQKVTCRTQGSINSGTTGHNLNMCVCVCVKEIQTISIRMYVAKYPESIIGPAGWHSKFLHSWTILKR